jgi:transposase
LRELTTQIAVATLRKKLRRGQVLEFFANLPPCVIGMEACGGAHYWARELRPRTRLPKRPGRKRC